jgi:hypothetical protein
MNSEDDNMAVSGSMTFIPSSDTQPASSKDNCKLYSLFLPYKIKNFGMPEERWSDQS